MAEEITLEAQAAGKAPGATWPWG